MKKLIILLTILVLGLNKSFGQFQTGMATSNLAGVMGITVNPANTNFLNNGTDFMLFSNPKPLILALKIPSAMGDRQILPKHTNKTLIISFLYSIQSQTSPYQRIRV